ncbi:MAG: aspartate carbamoyltransferase regulatory subunit [Dysgonamonadaceae bacterium]|jgi:aspartate carbamoyltransferase regulatory subunit|nr:aspartate carbamoyltransferase regulatory subunit [Dysgonamonadaceae bacterium]
MEQNKELKVAALENGTVIDHIPSEQVFQVVSLLEIEKLRTPVTIGYSLDSKKMGKKGIIKIADKFFEEAEINRISLIAPSVKLNIIRNYTVAEKKLVSLPDEVIGLVKCNNPKCICNNEPMKTRFNVIDKENVTLKCHYCESKIRKEKIILV